MNTTRKITRQRFLDKFRCLSAPIANSKVRSCVSRVSLHALRGEKSVVDDIRHLESNPKKYSGALGDRGSGAWLICQNFISEDADCALVRQTDEAGHIARSSVSNAPEGERPHFGTRQRCRLFRHIRARSMIALRLPLRFPFANFQTTEELPEMANIFRLEQTLKRRPEELVFVQLQGKREGLYVLKLQPGSPGKYTGHVCSVWKIRRLHQLLAGISELLHARRQHCAQVLPIAMISCHDCFHRLVDHLNVQLWV